MSWTPVARMSFLASHLSSRRKPSAVRTAFFYHVPVHKGRRLVGVNLFPSLIAIVLWRAAVREWDIVHVIGPSVAIDARVEDDVRDMDVRQAERRSQAGVAPADNGRLRPHEIRRHFLPARIVF